MLAATKNSPGRASKLVAHSKIKFEAALFFCLFHITYLAVSLKCIFILCSPSLSSAAATYTRLNYWNPIDGLYHLDQRAGDRVLNLVQLSRQFVPNHTTKAFYVRYDSKSFVSIQTAHTVSK